MNKQVLRWVGATAAVCNWLLLATAPPLATAKEEALTPTAQQLLQRFAQAEETLEYHFMLTVPAFTAASQNQAMADLVNQLRPVLQVGAITGPKAGAYIDTPDRALDKAQLILRLRPGQLTVKARSTSLNRLIDLEPCTGQKVKYERDFFEEAGYSISSEVKFKKEDWLPDPTQATVQQTMAFMQDKCPALLTQLEVYLKPIQAVAAPGSAQMFAADITLDHPLSAAFKESGFSFWVFPGTPHALAEIAWTGRAKDKAALDLLAQQVRAQLLQAGLLAKDQSSKTEQYFLAYFGPR
jgi:hypothetical protein